MHVSLCLSPICSSSTDLTLVRGSHCVTGEVSGNDEAPSLGGSQTLAEMEVVAAVEVKLDFGWKGIFYIKQKLSKSLQ